MVVIKKKLFNINVEILVQNIKTFNHFQSKNSDDTFTEIEFDIATVLEVSDNGEQQALLFFDEQMYKDAITQDVILAIINE